MGAIYTVLIIDDEDKVRNLLRRIISLEGYRVLAATTLGEGRTILSHEPVDVLLCDVRLPDGNGIDFTAGLKTEFPAMETILLTAFGNIPDSVTAIRNGVFDYIVKGNDNEKIIPLLSRVVEKVRLGRKVAELEKRLRKKYGFEAILGESDAMRLAVNLARKVAPTQAAVLLRGETGTGKEVFANAIHSNSQRAAGPFVALNCSALGRDIIESELFGYKAGAFTGAARDKKGLIEEARGGTLFLDEIGDMPAELQPKLLRFLENGTFYRVGDPTEYTADVRVIAATNCDLTDAIARGHFRSDLFYRLAVFTISIPSLHERGQDILMLARRFLHEYGTKIGKQIADLSAPVQQILLAHKWPGNVRELKNVIERAVILEDTDILSPENMPFELQQMVAGDRGASPDSLSLSGMESLHIRKVLRLTGGNKPEAARLLDIGLATLYRKIEEYGLKN
jgi:DNA-binding NtrC family response regulator